MPMWNWSGGGTNWAGWIAMLLVMVAFWGLLLLGIAMVVRSALGGKRANEDADRAPGSSRATAILEERFARGEIDEDEFETGKRVLSGTKEVGVLEHSG